MALTYLAYNLKREVNILSVKEIIKRLKEEKDAIFNLESYFRGKQRVSFCTACRPCGWCVRMRERMKDASGHEKRARGKSQTLYTSWQL